VRLSLHSYILLIEDRGRGRGRKGTAFSFLNRTAFITKKHLKVLQIQSSEDRSSTVEDPYTLKEDESINHCQQISPVNICALPRHSETTGDNKGINTTNRREKEKKTFTVIAGEVEPVS
jgi:hypothetical protein